MRVCAGQGLLVFFCAVDNKGIVVWAGVYVFLNEMR
jgi:hypothetical protein